MSSRSTGGVISARPCHWLSTEAAFDPSEQLPVATLKSAFAHNLFTRAPDRENRDRNRAVGSSFPTAYPPTVVCPMSSSTTGFRNRESSEWQRTDPIIVEHPECSDE